MEGCQRHIVTSAIVCRGLTVKLKFDSDIHQASWKQLKTKGSGGLSIGGWNFGMSGHYNSKTSWDLKDISSNSVTFADAPDVCRIIGLKVEDVLGESEKSVDHYQLDDPISEESLNKLIDNKISYGEFIDLLHDRK